MRGRTPGRTKCTSEKKGVDDAGIEEEGREGPNM